MNLPQDVLDILRKSYQLEVDGYTFYSMTAERSDKPAVQKLFARLADDERQHRVFLRDVAGNLATHGAEAFDQLPPPPDLRAFSDVIFTSALREQAQGAEFESGVLSVGIALEKNAIAYFTSAAAAAPHEQLRGFFQFLATWERQHLDALENAQAAIRDDFWKKAGLL
jgi:rubrerythrin